MLRAGRGLRWYVRQATGEAKWDEYVETCRAQGAEPMTGSVEQTTAYLRSEIDKWAKVVAASGTRVE